MRQLSFIILFFIIVIFSCNNERYNAIEKRNVSFMYKPGIVSFHPEFNIYHKTDTTSLLFVKLFPFELAKKIDEDSFNHFFRVRFQYKIYNTDNLDEVTDSSSVIIKSYQINDNDFITYIPLKISKSEYLIEIISVDLNNLKKNQNYISVNKVSTYTQQNFLVTRVESLRPLFNQSLNSNVIFKLNNQRNRSKDIYVKYYSIDIPSPMPPYFISNSRVLEITADSIYTINDYKEKELSLQKKGIYFIQLDTAVDEGLALYNFNSFYPDIKSASQLLQPLKYLTSFREYKRLETYKNQKIAIDSFWLNTAEEIEKARELIRIFYNRVQLANRFFTSYTEGWNTDRGMIFIVLGPPKAVYKSKDTERWSYGHRTSQPVLEFTFFRVDNPFTENSFALQRDENYSRVWNQAVDTWRGGLVFSIAE